MSRRINTQLSSLAALELAEMARRQHHYVATRDEVEIAHCHSDMYKASQKNFITAIKTAYPHMDAKRVYLLWVDCMESIAYCVSYIRNDNRYPF